MHQQAARPAADWIDVPAPHLAIVTVDTWEAAHARLATVRSIYLAGTDGRRFGRPPLGDPSKYLLTNLALCGCCGGSMYVRSRSHGHGRKHFYGCATYHERGRTVCANGADVPMVDADESVIEALLEDVLDQSIIEDAVEAALILDTGSALDPVNGRRRLEKEIAKVERERGRLVAAITAGGSLDGLLETLQTREARLLTLRSELAATRSQRRVGTSDVATKRSELHDLAHSWRTVLTHDQANARPIITALLKGRVTFTPKTERKVWEVRGVGTHSGLFSGEICRNGWRP